MLAYDNKRPWHGLETSKKGPCSGEENYKQLPYVQDPQLGGTPVQGIPRRWEYSGDKKQGLAKEFPLQDNLS
ncbi:MAG: hypothetical protein RBR15_10035 [Sphaerochaeta sp.]|nr:hypothetical protein [Sphaerochaeta sp.]